MTTTTTPRWLTAHATRTGNDPAFTGTRAQARHCRHCRRAVLAGYDAPRCATLAIVDPHPLTPQLEAAAVILARPTWRLWGTPGNYELTHRTPTTIRGITLTPANKCIVLARHDCTYPPLSTIPLPGKAAQPVVDAARVPF